MNLKIAGIIIYIVILFYYSTTWKDFLKIPNYRKRNKVVHLVTTFPNISFLIISVIRYSLFHFEQSSGKNYSFSFIELCFYATLISLLEEIYFRGMWKNIFGSSFLSLVLSSLSFGLYQWVLVPTPETFINFFTLGMIYFLSLEKYSLFQVCQHRLFFTLIVISV